MFESIKQDYRASARKNPGPFHIPLRGLRDSGFRATCFYPIGRWCRERRVPFGTPLAERFRRHASRCRVSTLPEPGPRFRIAHVCGIVVPPKVVFGANCEIRQNVTLGGSLGKQVPDGRTVPIIGEPGFDWARPGDPGTDRGGHRPGA